LNVWCQGEGKTGPFRSLAPVQQSQPANHGCYYWVFGVDPAAASVVLHGASAPRNHRVSMDDQLVALPPVARVVLHKSSGSHCPQSHPHGHVPARVHEDRKYVLGRHLASARATTQRDCANLYPTNDRRGPKTRPRWEHRRGRSLIALDMLAVPFVHGGEVLVRMWPLFQGERWVSRVRWGGRVTRDMVRMM
jgi:hypothetical protein